MVECSVNDALMHAHLCYTLSVVGSAVCFLCNVIALSAAVEELKGKDRASRSKCPVVFLSLLFIVLLRIDNY